MIAEQANTRGHSLYSDTLPSLVSRIPFCEVARDRIIFQVSTIILERQLAGY